jgi:hypothetical protein
MATQVNICNLALRRLGAREITAIDDGTKNADHCSAFWDYILDEVLDDYAWNFAKKSRTLNYTSGFGEFSDTDIKTISGITQANPAVVSCTGHGFLDEHTVYIYDVLGMTEVNGEVYEIEKIDANSFRLLGINSSPWTAYDSCGSCIRKESQSKYSEGYTYDLPADYLKALHLDGEIYDFEIAGTGFNRRLMTTVSDAVLVYVAEETTTTNMLNRFISTMAWRLASELAIPLGKKAATQEKMMGMYNYVLGKSTATDARSERQALVDADPWLVSGGFIV